MFSAHATYDEVAQAYDEESRGAFGELYDHLTRVALARVLPPAGAHVLDVGGGTGKHARPLAASGYRVTVVDVSRGMLDVARRTTRGEARAPGLVRGSLERLPVPDASVDFVLCEGDPLSYCLDRAPEGAREILRVLRPGGGFYVSCDSRWYGAVALLAMGATAEGLACLARGASRDPYGAPVRAFAPDDLRALLREAGAEDVRVHGKVALAHLMPDEALQALWDDPSARDALRRAEERLLDDPSVPGLASHVVATGRKGAGSA